MNLLNDQVAQIASLLRESIKLYQTRHYGLFWQDHFINGENSLLNLVDTLLTKLFLQFHKMVYCATETFCACTFCINTFFAHASDEANMGRFKTNLDLIAHHLKCKKRSTMHTTILYLEAPSYVNLVFIMINMMCVEFKPY